MLIRLTEICQGYADFLGHTWQPRWAGQDKRWTSSRGLPWTGLPEMKHTHAELLWFACALHIMQWGNLNSACIG